MVGLAFLALPVSSAVATTSSVSPVLSIGPLTAKNGFKVTIFSSCNGAANYANVSVVKAKRHYSLGHYYYDDRTRASKCTATSKLGSGTLILRWGRLLHGKLKFAHAGRLRKIPGHGCPSPGHQRKVKGTGTLTMAIHTTAFGKLVIHATSAAFQRYDTEGTCGGSKPATTVGLNASFIKLKRFVTAYETNGKRTIDVGADDSPSRNVGGDMTDLFFGSSLFSFKSNLSSAHIGSLSPLLTGSLKYTATAACTAARSSGKLKGRLVLHDPALGTLKYYGSGAGSGPGGPQMYRTNGSCS